MNYLSTKQAAQLWGISPRRVAQLASQGRIPDAVSSGSTWLIPDSAQKPADNRCKEQRNNPEEQKREIYPYIICMVHSEDQLNRFTDDEKELCRACMLYEEGDLFHTGVIAGKLLSSEDPNIRLGALYLLTFTGMYQSDYACATKYSVLFLNEYYSVPEPSVGMKLIFAAYELEMGRTSNFLNCIDSVDPCMLPRDMLSCYYCQKLFAELIKFNLCGKHTDLVPYETLCMFFEADGYHYSAMHMHLSLSIFFALLGEPVKEYYHMSSSVELCVRHRFYFTLACLVSPAEDSAKALLSRFSSEERAHVENLNAAFTRSRIEYADYIKKHSLLSCLSENDYRLIFCCLRGYTISDTAKILGLSRSGTNRRLAKLYDKLGVDSMKEMKRVYLDGILEWGK